MKVGDLIYHLSKLDPNSDVYYYDGEFSDFAEPVVVVKGDKDALGDKWRHNAINREW